MIADGRLAALRSRLSDARIPVFLVTEPNNIVYITGFEGVFDSEDAHVALVTPDSAVLYTDSRYQEAACAAAEGSQWEVRLAKGSLYEAVCDDVVAGHTGVIAVESSVPYGRFKFISEKLGGKVEVLDQWVNEIRQVKDAAEQQRVAAAQALTDRAFDHILSHLCAGATESHIALELEFFMRREGSEGVAFSPIVASGPNSAFPHAKVTNRAIQPGDFVKLDFGARVDGYCADMTRTVVIGTANARQREVYRAVLDANLAGIAAVLPGVPGRAVDAAARAILDMAGLGEFFGHGLGHGVGLDVHELPNVGPRGSKSLRRGNVITIEPGVYIPGFGGVRIEDLLVVEESGPRVLTNSTKELLEL